MRLSELEYRVRQTESFIQLSEELKATQHTQKKQVKTKTVLKEINEKLDQLSNDTSTKIKALEEKWTSTGQEMKDSMVEFEAKHVQQQIELAQSLEKAYTLTSGLKEELESTFGALFQAEKKKIIDFKEVVENQLATMSRETHTLLAKQSAQNDKQMQEVCYMMEELAKVVKSYEPQIRMIKSQTESLQDMR